MNSICKSALKTSVLDLPLIVKELDSYDDWEIKKTGPCIKLTADGYATMKLLPLSDALQCLLTFCLNYRNRHPKDAKDSGAHSHPEYKIPSATNSRKQNGSAHHSRKSLVSNKNPASAHAGRGKTDRITQI